MTSMKSDDVIVIALLPRPMDLHRARAGWYRVPVAHAPPVLAEARALAFYQPASFGENRWQVQWWAPVRSFEMLTRRMLLPEEPTHRRADEQYLRFDLAPLERLDPPKRTEKGRRLLFVPTTWGEFSGTQSLDELVAHPTRPIADDPLYAMIKQQISGSGGIHDPDRAHQKRLFEFEDADYEALDW